ncbi:MAG: Uncharacterized protein CEO21_303 [Microgenomates group bacterium Gr01-1014_80]|nr:MAG: Uncharacterized protein CEO21_303 [Microgenomates group bacterium Gr01-1014_80]
MKQRGIIHLLPLLLVVVLIIVGFLVYSGKIKLPFSLPFGKKQATNVELKSEYKNPFNKETQYVNPFETYKNPFVVNR